MVLILLPNTTKDHCSHLPSEWRDSHNVSVSSRFLLPICDKNHWRLLLIKPDQAVVTTGLLMQTYPYVVYDSWPTTSTTTDPWLDDHVMLLFHTEPPKMPEDREILPRNLVSFIVIETKPTSWSITHGQCHKQQTHDNNCGLWVLYNIETILLYHTNTDTPDLKMPLPKDNSVWMKERRLQLKQCFLSLGSMDAMRYRRKRLPEQPVMTV